jgi:hypothetical protein
MGNAAGKALPYAPGERVTGLRHRTVWTVHEGTSTAAGSSSDAATPMGNRDKVLIFRYEKRPGVGGVPASGTSSGGGGPPGSMPRASVGELALA